MNSEDLSKLNKILIIRLSSLGDILLTTPFIRSLKNMFPKLQIDFLLRQEYSDALINNPYINTLYRYSREKESNKKVLADIKRSNYELIIDLQNNFRSKKIKRSLNVLYVSFDKKTIKKFLLVNLKINLLKNAQQIPVRYAQVIENLNLDNDGIDLFTPNKPDEKLDIQDNLIGLCPGARHFTKQWPKEYFIALGKKLSESGYKVLLFGGRIDKQLCEEISNEIPGSINLANEDDLLQTAANMKMCKAIICNDSGLMHVASSTNTKVVAIFGSTVKEFGFTPYNCDDLILENKSLTCRPCSHIGRSSCPKKHFKCMREISPELVFEKVKVSLKS